MAYEAEYPALESVRQELAEDEIVSEVLPGGWPVPFPLVPVLRLLLPAWLSSALWRLPFLRGLLSPSAPGMSPEVHQMRNGFQK